MAYEEKPDGAQTNHFAQDLGPNLTATVVTTGLLAFITMGLRVFTRITRKSWGIEDWVMLIGCVWPFELTRALARSD